MSGQGGSKTLSAKHMLGSMQIRYSVKEVAIGERLNYAIVTTSQNFLVLDLAFEDVSVVVRRSAYPRMAKLSTCERYFLATFTDNTVFLIGTRTGNTISKILGIPRSVTNFVLSYDSSRIFYANSNTICLWNTAKGQLQLTSAQWRNINSYALNRDGSQIALGTYDGGIIFLSVISHNRVTQMTLKRHKSCVMNIAFSDNKIFSVSYDRIFLTTTIHKSENGSKQIQYLELYLENVPRGIQGVEGIPHFYETQGLFWIVQGNKMRGYAEGQYSICKHRTGPVHVIRYLSGRIQWFIR